MVFGFGLQVGEGAIEGPSDMGGGKVAVRGDRVGRGVPAHAQFGDFGLAHDGHAGAALRRGGSDFGGCLGGNSDFHRRVDDYGIRVFAARECC